MKNNQRQKTTVGVIHAAVLEFTAGRDAELDLALVAADCLGTAAHVIMLSEMPVRPPIISSTECRKVLAALADIVRRAKASRFRISLQDQDVHLAIERELTAELGDLGKKVHTGRSRNDQVAVDMRIYAKQQLLGTLNEVAVLADTLVRFAIEHAADPMVGRTHMQPAMPSSVGLWASAHAESLLDDAALLINAYELNDQCPLGSAASYGVPLPIDRQRVSDLLGFSRPVHNVLYANNARGKMEAIILSALSQVMITVSRLAQDLILYSMPEFGYFALPAEFCTGSSIMPQKRNPDVLELVRAKAARVMAASLAVQDILRSAPSGYNRDIQEAKEPFIEALNTTRACLRILALLAGRLTVNRKALLKGFTPDVFATDRALELVGEGMPFRDAYHHVKTNLGELVRMDPYRAIALKTHLGASAGLDFDALLRRVAELQALVRADEKMIARVEKKLLGKPR